MRNAFTEALRAVAVSSVVLAIGGCSDKARVADGAWDAVGGEAPIDHTGVDGPTNAVDSGIDRAIDLTAGDAPGVDVTDLPIAPPDGGAGGAGGLDASVLGGAGSGGITGTAGAGSGGATGGTTIGTGGAALDAGTDQGKPDVLVDVPTDIANRDIGNDAPVCSGGLTACGADCVDLASSTADCGSCFSACGTGQTCNHGVCVEGGTAGSTDGCSTILASNLTLQQIAVYQSVKIPVMQDGAEVVAGSRNASVVPGRDTLFRIFVTLGSGWTARELAARLTLTPPDGTPARYYSRKIMAASSVDSDFNTTFQIFVPLSAMVTSLRYSVEVVECGSLSGNPGKARFPTSSDIELQTKNTGSLKLTIIPLKAGSYTPDTSASALAGYAAYLKAMYPVNDVSIAVGDALTAATPVDWNTMLDQVRAKRTNDKPANDVYYFGLVKPAEDRLTYCTPSCTTGIAFVVTDATGSLASSGRAAVGAAFGDSPSWETMAHELGHNHGRNHAPCTSGGTILGVDPKYPYADGGIGVWGYDSRTQKLWDPAIGRDLMGYCTNLWVSDYTYNGLLARVQAVNGVNMIYTPDHALSRWRILLFTPSGPRWGIPITDNVPAEGEPEQATIYDSAGLALTSVAVYRTEISDGFGSMVMVPEPRSGWHAVGVAGAPALPFAP